jgi:hypothetical protein
VRLLEGGRLRSASVRGRGTAIGVEGDAAIDSVEIRALSGDGIRAACAAVTARHVTLVGVAAETGVAASCGQPGRQASVGLRNSVVSGEFDDAVGAGVETAFSQTDPDADPGFVSATDLRLADDSPLRDAGDPAPLADAEWHEDAGGLARVADGDGDGLVRRDIGAHERPAAAVAVPGANVLANPGAEDGSNGWSGGLVAERYGTFPFASAETGLALGAGARFFAGGLAEDVTSRQVVDLSAMAPEIDAGGAVAVLSALLGGYRADQDEATVTATFRNPHGESVGTLSIGPVTAAERGHGITLLPRRASGTIPPLSRMVDVAMRAVRRGGGAYADAYFDNVALVLDVPGLPPPKGGESSGGQPGQPPPSGPKPFAGVAVLTASAVVDRRGRAVLRLACASATVRQCAGVVTITTVPRRGRPARRLGAARFSLSPGRVVRVHVHIGREWRQKLRRRKQLKVRLYAAARDGQGVARATTSPLRLRRR